jgi:transcriptional regulator GlxA family with amidase domain
MLDSFQGDNVMRKITQDKLPAARRNFLKSASVAALGIGELAKLKTPALTGEREKEMSNTLDVVIYLYNRMTALDAIGPYEVLRCAPGARVRFAAKKAGLVQPDSGLQMLNAEHSIFDIDSADILVVPGGDPTAQINDKETLQWIRSLHEKTRWTTSVCTGSLILGAAGLLKGLQATTYWSSIDLLKMFGAEPVAKRFVRQGKIITAAGVSAGIDMALSLVALDQGEEMAQTIQLLIEYDPQPPFNTGSRSKASPAMIEKAKKMLNSIYAPVKR